MNEHPDDAKLDEAHFALTESMKERQRTSVVEMSLVAGAAVLIALSTMFSAWNTFELRRLTQDAAEVRKIILLGTECIVEQLAEHRHSTALVHREDAGHHGYPYPILPENEPPVVPGVLEHVCKTFLQTTTSTGKP